jgi:rhamnose utilization protein RhaD (predicted bifunctional aldolase and dehydrogenase)
MRESINLFCAKIGANSKLVQGAGGNISWKEDGTLWIKASGAWLSEASKRNIFVPADLAFLQDSIASENFLVTPKLIGGTEQLRASIETLLHALMPQRVVLHLHAIEPLAHLVRRDFELNVSVLLDKKFNWTSTKYHKPGAALAEAVSVALKLEPDSNVVLLGNHGIVIGASTLDEINDILCQLTAVLAVRPRDLVATEFPAYPIKLENDRIYLPISDSAIHQLAADEFLFDLLPYSWALYPDHIVFLGAKPFCYDSIDEVYAEYSCNDICPEIIFVRKMGVFSRSGLSIAKIVQLRCYYDVLARQKDPELINVLGKDQVAELLDWDAEHYRVSITKQSQS